ncbi:MAG TPA: YfhO family protein [Thermoanaerobaculia bacterium]|nr:YfhO family protein [Thermoanaerobaculia bacterium]
MIVVLTALGIVVPSLLITLAVRRWLEPISWRIVGLCLVLAFLFVVRGVFTSGVPVPLDEIVRGYPYRGVFGDVQSKNYLTNDTVKQILPWMQTVREDFAHGRAPLWNPYLFCGYPLLGNGQSAPFSPFFLLTLFVPLPKQLVAMAGVKLFVALLFGYLFAKREGVGDAAAMLASVVFAFAIFNNAFLYYPMTAVTLLLPAAAYATLLCLEQRRAAPVVLLALVIASLLAGGHPESVVHVVLGVLAVLAIDGSLIANRRSLLRVVIASLLGLVIAAPAWVPVLEQVLVSLRVVSLKAQQLPVFPLTTLWAMLNPDGFGNPAHGNWNWYWSYTHVASVYLGLIVMVLVPPALLSRGATRRDRLLVLLAIVFFLISMTWTPLGRVFYAIPLLGWIAHDRLRFVVAFLVGLIAARLVERFRGEVLLWAALGSIAVFALGGYVFVKLLGKTLTWWSIAGLAALALFWIVALVARRWLPVAALVLTTIELFLFTFDYNAIALCRYYVPRLPIIDALQHAAPAEPYRVLGLDWVLLPNAAEQYHFQDPRGSDPMEWADYMRFFRVAEIEDASIDVKRIADPAHPAIDFLNVRYLMTEPNAGLGGKWRRIYAGVDGELYENGGVLPRFFAPRLVRRVGAGEWEAELRTIGDFHEVAIAQGKGLPAVFANPEGVRIAVREEGATRLRLAIDAPAEALIASSQPAMRWWSVLINGKASGLFRVNGAFLGFRAPRGHAEVVVRYQSWSFYAAVGAALAGVLALVWYARRQVPQTVE